MREAQMNARFGAERNELMKSWDHAEKKTKEVSEANVKLKALVQAVREKVNLLEKENKTVWDEMGHREKAMQDTIEKWRNGKWVQQGEGGISDAASGIGYDQLDMDQNDKQPVAPKPEIKKGYVGKERDLNAEREDVDIT
jgi:hypothetical protein